jgi:uncharacterized Zn-binding protein involved in type VI secretion
MPALAATRIGDICSGHSGFPPRVCASGSTDVFINGIGSTRVGDRWVVHCNPKTCHESVLAAGSSTVFVNGIAACRIGDSIACGSAVAEGSPSVFFG